MISPARSVLRVSEVTSKSGRSTNRIPGTLRAGGRATAATSRDDAKNG
jgi:hypothetical protein